jgi:hypothetical protein
MPRSKVGRVRTRSMSWGARSRGGRVEGLATRGNAARGGRNDVRRAQVAIGSRSRRSCQANTWSHAALDSTEGGARAVAGSASRIGCATSWSATTARTSSLPPQRAQAVTSRQGGPLGGVRHLSGFTGQDQGADHGRLYRKDHSPTAEALAHGVVQRALLRGEAAMRG